MRNLKPESGKTKFYIFLALVVMTASSLTGAYAQDVLDDWQLKVLHNPGPALLQAEANGRITIFDGLSNRDVEKALDEQFNRIDHMMFIRTRHQQQNGNVEVNDDDC